VDDASQRQSKQETDESSSVSETEITFRKREKKPPLNTCPKGEVEPPPSQLLHTHVFLRYERPNFQVKEDQEHCQEARKKGDIGHYYSSGQQIISLQKKSPE
jgi:hypothetical protein